MITVTIHGTINIHIGLSLYKTNACKNVPHLPSKQQGWSQLHEESELAY